MFDIMMIVMLILIKSIKTLLTNNTYGWKQ